MTGIGKRQEGFRLASKNIIYTRHSDNINESAYSKHHSDWNGHMPYKLSLFFHVAAWSVKNYRCPYSN